MMRASKLSYKNLSKIKTATEKYRLVNTKEEIVFPQLQEGKQALFGTIDADVIFYGGGAGSGKAGRASKTGKAIRDKMLSMADALSGKKLLSYNSSFNESQVKDSKVLGWNGQWIDFSDLKVGDKIMNPDGQYQEIIQIHEQGFKQFYRVSFEDGTSTECCGDHLWSFWESRRNSRRKSSNGINRIESNLTPRGWNTNYITRARVRDTNWLITEISKGRRFIVPVNAPLQFTALNRSDTGRAYFYGCLIGDGSYCSDSIIVTTSDRFIADKLVDILGKEATVKTRTPIKDDRLEVLSVNATKVQWVKSWISNNEYKGKRAWEKVFPDGYLSASLDFRYAFAQGLFDTDGTVGDKKREVSYCTTSKDLAIQVASLVRSLGYMAKITERQPKYRYKGEHLEGRTAYVVAVEGNHLELLFSLPRKVERAKILGQFNGGSSWPGKRIVSIEPTEIDYARCITVSNPNHLYLTDDYIVTHNSFALLADFARQEFISNPDYRAVIFRRTYPEFTQAGGLIDESQKIYQAIKGNFIEKPPGWRFLSGSKIAFRHLQYEKTVYVYQGGQIAKIGFDELTHFTEEQFFYLLSRNRSVSGIKPAVRATCNPDADSWVASFISWWIDPKTGYAIEERAGIIKYFIRQGGVVHWADSKQELIDRFSLKDELLDIIPKDKKEKFLSNTDTNITPDKLIKSFTFIPATIFDNPALIRVNPTYLANLYALHPIERDRLLRGNWKVKYEAGTVFDRTWFEILNKIPDDWRLIGKVRFWDLAATAKENAENYHCYTSGTLVYKYQRIKNTLPDSTEIKEFAYVVADNICEQKKVGEVELMLKNTAELDGRTVAVRWEQEGGSSGKFVENTITNVIRENHPNHDVKAIAPQGDKLTRALPVATAASRGQIFILRDGTWNTRFLNACQGFDGSKKTPPTNDIVDSLSGAFYSLENEFQGHEEVISTIVNTIPVNRFRGGFKG